MGRVNNVRLQNKTFLDILLVCLCILFIAAVLFMPRKINIIVDNTIISKNETAIRRNERFYLPVRHIAESVGYTVAWESRLSAIGLDNGQNKTNMWVGNLEYLKNGEAFYMRELPFIHEGSTYMLAEDIAAMFDCIFKWNSDEYTIYIESSN